MSGRLWTPEREIIRPSDPRFAVPGSVRNYKPTNVRAVGGKRRAAAAYATAAVVFSSDYMARGADFTGVSDSKRFIFSCWVKLNGSDGSNIALIANDGFSGTGYHINRTNGNKFECLLRNAAGATIQSFATTTSYTAGATWRHFLASCDAAATTRHLYMNDVSDLTGSTNSNDTADWTQGDHFIGGNSAAAQLNADIADFYFAPGQYLDFSVEANRRKFISAAGKPVNLGANGSTPTGTAPAVFLKAPAAGFATNLGTGGNFTLTGTLGDASGPT